MIIEDIKEIGSLPAPALGLLPAVHDATVTPVYGTALPAVAAAQVFQNTAGSVLTLPAFGAWPPQKLPLGSFAGSDGRFWFPVRRYKATNSYYPEPFERVLYTLAFTPNSLPLGGTFTLTRKLSARLLANNTDAVWNFVWEIGMRTDQSSPAPVGPNIDTYVWREPLIDQQIHVTDVVSTHSMGVTLRRTLVNNQEAWQGDISRYEKVIGAVSAQLPTGNSFVLRLRLSCFDTQNDVPDPRGFVAYFCSSVKE